MLRLIIYISKIFLARWLVAVFGMVILVGLLDSLANASAIAASGDGGALRYMMLRAPVIYDLVIVFSIMLALLLTFVSLIRRNELVAIQGIGLSIFAQVRALVPIVLVVSIGSLFLINHTLPPSVQALNAWGIGEYEEGTVTEDEPLWLNDNGLFVRMKGRTGLDILTDLTFFHRDRAGYVQRVSWAQRATYQEGSWALEGIETLIVDSAEAPPPPLTAWVTNQTPLLIDKLAAEPRDLSLRDLTAFASFRGSGSRPSASYKVWYIKRISLPFSALALLLLAAPIMQKLGRRDTGTFELIIGVGAAFLFMIVDGILITMGANGALLPEIAALGAPIVIAAIGLYLWLNQEILA